MDTTKEVRARRGSRKRLTWLILLVVVLAAVGAVTYQVGLLQARLAIEARRHQTAESWLRIAGLVWPKNAEWYYLSAIVNRRLQRFESVEQCLQKAHELGWRVADLEREQTIAHAQSGQFQKVGNEWPDLLMTAGSDGPEICRAYVNFLLAGFRLNDASAVIKNWKADFPGDPGPYVVEGNITSVLLRWPEAEALFKQALRLDPQQIEARTKLAEALVKQLKFAEIGRAHV